MLNQWRKHTSVKVVKKGLGRIWERSTSLTVSLFDSIMVNKSRREERKRSQDKRAKFTEHERDTCFSAFLASVGPICKFLIWAVNRNGTASRN